VSLVDKEEIRKVINNLYVRIKDWYKVNLAYKISNIINEVENIALKAKDDNKEFIITQLDFGSDGKIAKKIQEKIKYIYPEVNQFILSNDEENERFIN